MRLERINPLSWLLGAIAACALLIWTLALLGMGKRIRAAESDPSLIQPLPALSASSMQPSASPERYAEIAVRPLFSEDRHPQPFVIGGEESSTSVFDYVLTSVLIAPPLEMAILQSTQGDRSMRLRTGQSLPSAQEWRLVSVTPRTAVFEGPEGERILEMRAYDGNNSGAATIVDASPTMALSASSPVVSTMPQEHVNSDAAASTATSTNGTPQSQEAQMEAIRRRIEARRAQLSGQADPVQSVKTE